MARSPEAREKRLALFPCSSATLPLLPCSPKAKLRELARQEECLVPIRLDLEHEGRKCNDTFTWNLHGEGRRTCDAAVGAVLSLGSRIDRPLTFAHLRSVYETTLNRDAHHPSALCDSPLRGPPPADRILSQRHRHLDQRADQTIPRSGRIAPSHALHEFLLGNFGRSSRRVAHHR